MSSSPLNEITSLLATSESLSSDVQTQVREQLQDARRSLEDASTELIGCLDAALTLVSSLPHLDSRAAHEVREMVQRLVGLVAASEAEAQEAAQRAAQEAAQEAARKAAQAAASQPAAELPDPEIKVHPLSPNPRPTPPPVAPPPVDEGPHDESPLDEAPASPQPEPPMSSLEFPQVEEASEAELAALPSGTELVETPEPQGLAPAEESFDGLASFEAPEPEANEQPPLQPETLELVGFEEEGDDDMDMDMEGLDELPDVVEVVDIDESFDIVDLEAELADAMPPMPQAAIPAPSPIPPAPAPMAYDEPAPALTPSGNVDYSVPKLNDMMLGEVMIQLGFVRKDEVDTALRRMAQYGQRFGEALIEIGAATAEDVAQGISLQRLLSQGAQQAQEAKFERANVLHAILLGEILVLMDRITRDQLKQGLEHQRCTGSRIGEALVELRFITWKDLDEAIRVQHARGGSSERNDGSTVVELE